MSNEDECSIERRHHSDRLTRVEVAVERIDSDVKSLGATYKEVAAQQQSMFIEYIKSSAHLQGAIEALTKSVCDFAIQLKTIDKKIEHTDGKVEGLEQWKWKAVGIVIGVVAVVNVIGWFVTRF